MKDINEQTPAAEEPKIDAILIAGSENAIIHDEPLAEETSVTVEEFSSAADDDSLIAEEANSSFDSDDDFAIEEEDDLNYKEDEEISDDTPILAADEKKEKKKGKKKDKKKSKKDKKAKSDKKDKDEKKEKKEKKSTADGERFFVARLLHKTVPCHSFMYLKSKFQAICIQQKIENIHDQNSFFCVPARWRVTRDDDFFERIIHPQKRTRFLRKFRSIWHGKR